MNEYVNYSKRAEEETSITTDDLVLNVSLCASVTSHAFEEVDDGLFLVKHPRDTEDVDNFPEIKGKYRILGKIGEGGEVVALKRIYPTCGPERIMNEISHLKKLGGTAHVAKFLGGLRCGDHVSIILPYFQHSKFKDVLPEMTEKHIKEYMTALFVSLEHLHKYNVAHRDIKPGNFLYNKAENSFLLVDFGLAQVLEPQRKREDAEDVDTNVKRTKTEERASLTRSSSAFSALPSSSQFFGSKSTNKVHAPRGGTRGFRAPEVLLRSIHQTVAIDIWSAGTILLCILSSKYPFFSSPDDLSSLSEIGALRGTKEVKEMARQLGKRVEFPFEMPKQNLKQLCDRLNPYRKHQVSMQAYDLLERCLDLNPNTRITAEAALTHPFLSKSSV